MTMEGVVLLCARPAMTSMGVARQSYRAVYCVDATPTGVIPVLVAGTHAAANTKVAGGSR